MLEHTDIFGAKPVVLMVGQDAEALQLFRKPLERHGFQVQTVASGQAAIELYQKHPEHVAAILLEEHLAGLEGPTTGSALHQLKPYVPICFLSDSVDEQRMEELRQHGVRYVFTKPYNPEGIAILLQDIVNCAARELVASGVH